MTTQRTKVALTMGPAPKSFIHTITVLLPGNKEVEIDVDYVYRTKREYIALNDEQKKRSKALADEAANATKKHFSMTEDDWEKLDEFERIHKVAEYLEKGKKTKNMPANMDEQMLRDANNVLEVAQGWDVEGVEFTAANLVEVEDRYPGIMNAIVQGYGPALFGVRLKN